MTSGGAEEELGPRKRFLRLLLLFIAIKTFYMNPIKVFESVKSCKYFMNMEICFTFLRLISLILSSNCLLIINFIR